MKAEFRERLAKSASAHKFDHGHALVLAGAVGHTGAARLAARGALRVGAGLVTLGAPATSLLECAVNSTAVMVRRSNGAEELSSLLSDARINALCFGPGWGVARAAGLLPTAVSRFAGAVNGGCVLDADALTAQAETPTDLHPRIVLTPHGGEFARLFPSGAQDEKGVRTAAKTSGAIVLLKGARTVIASPTAEAAIVEAKAPWLATAGSGDVLAGIITGLLARGFEPFEAAHIGAELHGAAARAFGPGLIAEDLPEMLPRVFRDLGL